MVKRKDVLVITCALLLALLSWGAVRLLRAGQTAISRVDVYVNGEFYQSAALVEGESMRIEQADGSVNVLRFTQGGFFMESSTCKNQLCVRQGEVNAENFATRSLGAHILCLPNRVDARLATEDAAAPDA